MAAGVPASVTLDDDTGRTIAAAREFGSEEFSLQQWQTVTCSHVTDSRLAGGEGPSWYSDSLSLRLAINPEGRLTAFSTAPLLMGTLPVPFIADGIINLERVEVISVEAATPILWIASMNPERVRALGLNESPRAVLGAFRAMIGLEIRHLVSFLQKDEERREGRVVNWINFITHGVIFSIVADHFPVACEKFGQEIRLSIAASAVGETLAQSGAKRPKRMHVYRVLAPVSEITG